MKMNAMLYAISRATTKILPLLLSLAALPAAAQVSVTATGGTPGPTTYTTLKNAFDAINAGTHQAVITITVTGNTTETATADLVSSGTGAASYTRVVIKPGTGTAPTISGSIATAVIKLSGADNVVIDGSNTAGGTTRDMTILNSNTGLTSIGIWIASASATNGATGDTIRNCKIEGTSGATTVAGILAGSGAVVGDPAQAAASNNTILNNAFAKTQNGIYANGAVSLDQNWLISQNTFGSTVAAGKLGFRGMLALNMQNLTISDNTINGVTLSVASLAVGIYIGGAQAGVNITRNKISDIKNTIDFGSAGMYLAPTTTASAVAINNNFVSDVASAGFNGFTPDDNGNGIVLAGGGGFQVYHNTVWLNTNQTLAGGSRAAAMLITNGITTASSINLRNNLLINTQTVGNGNSRFAMVVTAANNVFAAMNFNDYYSASGNLTCRGGATAAIANATIQSNIAGVQSNLGLNGSSISFNPVFVSSTNLHVVPASNAALDNTGVTIAAVTTDIDGDPRATPPDIGADEFSICSPVTAGANPVNASICTPADASFTASATGATSYQWQVNSGSGFANITNGGVYGGATTPSLSLTAPPASMSGYQYRLVSGTISGCPTVNSTAATLTVNQTPSTTVTASGPVAICTGGSVTLSAPSVAGYSYQWNDGGNTISSATAASHSTSSPGSYTVTVTNPNGNCSATSSPAVNVTVGSGPTAVITPAGSAGFCTGGSVTLSAGNTAGVTYQWKRNNADVGSGNTFSASTAGSYTVLVTSGPGCSTLSVPVIVNENPLPVASITPSGDAAFCQGGSITLTGNPGGGLSRQWQIGGNDIGSATGPTYAAATPGSYTLRVTNNATGCQRTSAAVNVTQNPLPPASITPATFAPICEGDSVLMTANTGTGLMYQWKLNTGGIGGAVAGSYYAKASGSYTVTVTDGNGCQKTSNAASLTVNPAPPAFITYNSPLSFCEGSAVVLNANPATGLQYQWLRNGGPLTGQTGLNYMAAQSGTYTIITRNSFNCTRTSEPVDVTVYSRPQPVIAGVNAVLHAGPNYVQYQWFRHNVAIAGATDSVYTVSQNGLYSVYVKDDKGCDNKSPQYNIEGLGLAQTAAATGIRVYPNPAQDVVSIEQTGASRISGLVLLNGLGAVVYRAELTGGGSQTSIHVEHLAAGIYTLRVQLEDGSVALRRLELLAK